MNEHAPDFTASPYSFSVSEDAAVGATVGTLTSTDADAGVDGECPFLQNTGMNVHGWTVLAFSGHYNLQQCLFTLEGGFTFSISTGNTENKFQILADPMDPTIGHILVLHPLDRETTTSYSLVLHAVDLGGRTGD